MNGAGQFGPGSTATAVGCVRFIQRKGIAPLRVNTVGYTRRIFDCFWSLAKGGMIGSLTSEKPLTHRFTVRLVWCASLTWYTLLKCSDSNDLKSLVCSLVQSRSIAAGQRICSLPRIALHQLPRSLQTVFGQQRTCQVSSATGSHCSVVYYG